MTFAVPQSSHFSPPVPQSVLVNDPDTNEALSDFQVYARALRPSLAKKGIDFQEVYTRSFKVKCGGAVTTFAPGDRVLGYYLIAPDRPPRVEYGVRTDTDLLQIANEYFAIEPQAAK